MILRGHTGYLFLVAAHLRNMCVRVAGPRKKQMWRLQLGAAAADHIRGGLSSHPPSRRVGNIKSSGDDRSPWHHHRTDRAASGGVTGKGWRTSGRFRFILAPHWSASCGHRVFAVSQWRDRLELDGVDDDEKKEKGPYAICWRDVSRPIYRTGRRGGCARHASRAIHGRGAWRIEQHLHVPFWTTRSLGMRFAQPGNTAT
jgi:hypothetical protein